MVHRRYRPAPYPPPRQQNSKLPPSRVLGAESRIATSQALKPLGEHQIGKTVAMGRGAAKARVVPSRGRILRSRAPSAERVVPLSPTAALECSHSSVLPSTQTGEAHDPGIGAPRFSTAGGGSISRAVTSEAYDRWSWASMPRPKSTRRLSSTAVPRAICLAQPSRA